MNVEITSLLPKHWPEVSRIYGQGIATGIATFETTIPNWETWNASHVDTCRYVAKIDDDVVGWAALSPVSGRCVYGGVAEVSIYVDTGLTARGIGNELMKVLVQESEKAGFWTLQSGIFPENIASVQLHKKHGFREIGYRERVAKLKDAWYNNMLLERRSKTIGTD